MLTSSPEVIRLVVMMYAKYLLSLRNVDDLLFERGNHRLERTIAGGPGNRQVIRSGAQLLGKE